MITGTFRIESTSDNPTEPHCAALVIDWDSVAIKTPKEGTDDERASRATGELVRLALLRLWGEKEPSQIDLFSVLLQLEGLIDGLEVQKEATSD